MTRQHRKQGFSLTSEIVPPLQPHPFTPKHVSKRVNRSIIFSGISWIFAVVVFMCTVLMASTAYAGNWSHEWFIDKFATGLFLSAMLFPLTFVLGTAPIKKLQRLLPNYINTELTVLMLKVIFGINIIALFFWITCAVIHLYTFLA